jgi:hypothetical protein
MVLLQAPPLLCYTLVEEGELQQAGICFSKKGSSTPLFGNNLLTLVELWSHQGGYAKRTLKLSPAHFEGNIKLSLFSIYLSQVSNMLNPFCFI